MSTLLKLASIRALWVGRDARKTADDMVGEGASYFLNKDWLHVPSSTTIGDYSEYFDALYNTPANRQIGWEWAMILASMKARDDDSDDRLSLIRFLRENTTLPTFGEFVKAGSGDTVTIKSENKYFDIHLDGTTADNLNLQQQQQAVKFLRSLSKVTYSDCSKTHSAYLTVEYVGSIFRGDNKLSANVKVKYQDICVGRRKFPLSAIGGGKILSLNSMMLAKGLLHTDTFSDPKWTKEMRDTRKWAYSNTQAKKDELYVYGAKTDPIIEAITVGDRKL